MIRRMTEKEKMLAGEVYSAIDPELIEELMMTREVLYEYEGNPEGLARSCGR